MLEPAWTNKLRSFLNEGNKTKNLWCISGNRIFETQYLEQKFRGGGYRENARYELMQYRQKPVGYYETITNYPTQEGIDLSVIIPMYNCEDYIRECIESILLQNTKFVFEIICIDDESPDNASGIVDKIAQTSQVNIRVVRQHNRGAAGARNRGLDEAVGKYVMFVDADDRLEKNMVEKLLLEAHEKQVDIVSCGFYTFSETKLKEYVEPSVCVFNSAEKVMRKYPGYFWGRIYKRTLWDNLRMPEGYEFEDMIVLSIIPKLCKSFSYISEALYGYRLHAESITSTLSNSHKSIDQYWMTEYIEGEFDRLALKKDIIFYKSMLSELSVFLYNRTKNLPRDVREYLFSCACDRISQWSLERNCYNKIEKRVIHAFEKKDFVAWENASKYWH